MSLQTSGPNCRRRHRTVQEAEPHTLQKSVTPQPIASKLRASKKTVPRPNLQVATIRRSALTTKMGSDRSRAESALETTQRPRRRMHREPRPGQRTSRHSGRDGADGEAAAGQGTNRTCTAVPVRGCRAPKHASYQRREEEGRGNLAEQEDQEAKKPALTKCFLTVAISRGASTRCRVR